MWVAPGQFSFPLNLPNQFFGIFPTGELDEDGRLGEERSPRHVTHWKRGGNVVVSACGGSRYVDDPRGGSALFPRGPRHVTHSQYDKMHESMDDVDRRQSTFTLLRLVEEMPLTFRPITAG